MKIEKKKVIGSSNISSIAKSAFAVALGITTVSMTACEDPSSALRNDDDPDINSSNDTADIGVDIGFA